MLRFGDRLFYKDWWNATDMSTYYRTWNIVVYEWLYTYVYRDMYPLCGKKCRTLAITMVFFLSAVVHEYILTVAFRFFYPVLFLQFFLAAGPVGLMSVLRSTKERFWNVLLWCCILFGTGMLMCFYSCEWYARQNCPPVYNGALDVFVPRSWTCQTGSAHVNDGRLYHG
ncbi:unnamed protein product [Soboliphyme baturini]|uniref:O-acyltransferase n=1 Tax=Soboliphyme baturini TaxID=241478 RepID=A0A183IUM6_9BILA|nr:unnamed protein product [Soboliphyme baturini]